MSLTPATFGGAAVNGSSGAGKPFRSPTITPALPGIALSCGCRTISTCDSGEGGAAGVAVGSSRASSLTKAGSAGSSAGVGFAATVGFAVSPLSARSFPGEANSPATGGNAAMESSIILARAGDTFLT